MAAESAGAAGVVREKKMGVMGLMMQAITIRYAVRPVRRSLATNAVADLFGLAADDPPLVVADNIVLDVRPGDVVLFVGPSGSGKSSLLRAVGNGLGAVDAMTLALPDVPLIDALPGQLKSRLDLLAACGLSEARLLLRTPSELSDGQRYRFRLALALADPSRKRERRNNPKDSVADASGSDGFILADEFCAMLDRTLAKVLAFNLRRLCTRIGTGALLATTHEDFIDDLQPDLLVRCHGEGSIDVDRRPSKKNGSVSRISFGSPRGPSPIGRTSLGGIIAATISGSSGESSCSGTASKPSASASLPARRRVSRCGRNSSGCIGRDRANTLAR
jgi:energy-coupling factor transporter ATP-binding protein EcfA2